MRSLLYITSQGCCWIAGCKRGIVSCSLLCQNLHTTFPPPWFSLLHSIEFWVPSLGSLLLLYICRVLVYIRLLNSGDIANDDDDAKLYTAQWPTTLQPHHHQLRVERIRVIRYISTRNFSCFLGKQKTVLKPIHHPPPPPAAAALIVSAARRSFWFNTDKRKNFLFSFLGKKK